MSDTDTDDESLTPRTKIIIQRNQDLDQGPDSIDYSRDLTFTEQARRDDRLTDLENAAETLKFNLGKILLRFTSVKKSVPAVVPDPSFGSPERIRSIIDKQAIEIERLHAVNEKIADAANKMVSQIRAQLIAYEEKVGTKTPMLEEPQDLDLTGVERDDFLLDEEPTKFVPRDPGDRAFMKCSICSQPSQFREATGAKNTFCSYSCQREYYE